MVKGCLAAGVAALAVLSFAACSSSSVTNTNRVLVIDKVFDLATGDPHRELGMTGALVAKALYSTLLTFSGGDESRPVPLLATSYTSSEDARTFIFKLRRDVVFSDGSPLTSADVVFSINRVVNLKSPPSTLLAGVSVSAPDASTVLLMSSEPFPSLPFILASPTIAIVNSKVVQGHGGTDAPGADRADKAAGFLSGTSAGSGPYVLESFSTFSDIVLRANPRYWGPKPSYARVVIRNMSALTQLAYIASATDEVALDLSYVQAANLMRNRSVTIRTFTAPDVIFVFANDNPMVSSVTSNRHFQRAVRYALDYKAMVQVAGPGAVQAPGVIPEEVFGALPAWIAPRRDLDIARAEVVASGIKNPTVNLGFADDLAVNGLPMSVLARMITAELGDAGIKVNLAGSRATAAMADYSAGSQQLGLWSIPASSADPAGYIAFLPGRPVGLRAGWHAGADPSLESLGIQAGTTADMPTRAQLFQHMQGQLNEDGPFFPLLQPGRIIVSSNGISGIVFNPSWSIDIAALSR